MPPSGDSVAVGAGAKGPEAPNHWLGRLAVLDAPDPDFAIVTP